MTFIITVNGNGVRSTSAETEAIAQFEEIVAELAQRNAIIDDDDLPTLRTVLFDNHTTVMLYRVK